ncbi:MAG: DNA polymerase III subunit beta [Candidatus Cloacimonadaceae bacterium]
MKFAIDKKDLQNCIQHLVSVAPSKNVSPILTNYLIQASVDTGKVRITTSDLEITVVAEVDAAVNESGSIAVSSKHFNEIIHAMPEAMINFSRHEDLLRIQSNKINFNLLIADHTLFPLVPEIDLTNAIKIDAKLFNRMISKTQFAVSSDVNRKVLTGVCWKIMPDSHLMAATDGRKVAEIKINNSALFPADSPIFSGDMGDEGVIEKIIPVKTLAFMQKIYDTQHKEVSFLIEANKVIFSYGSYLVFSQIIEHKYPEYQKAFVVDLQNRFEVKKDALQSAIRRVALVAPGENQRIRIEVSNEQFVVNTTSRDTGDAKENLDDYHFEGIETGVSFSFRYMLSILDVVDSEKVVINLGTSRDPLMIYNQANQENEEITFLLMPLRS